MRRFRMVAIIAAVAGLGMTAQASWAQISIHIGIPGVGVRVGPAPVCPYGYYDYSPYYCAPYGYYGPEWFAGGVFIGAGPWYHGGRNFHGHVNNAYDPRHGYHGPRPGRGEQRAPGRRVDHMDKFHGNEVRDGRGHSTPDHR